MQYNGKVFTRQDKISEAMDDYYAALLGSATAREHSLNLDLLDLSSHDLLHLEVPFSEEEVEKTIKSMPLDKAPGPNGFTGRFYTTCWQIIKHDFM